MDPAAATSANANSTAKTTSEAQPRIQAPQANGVLRRHAPVPSLHPPVVVTYRDCQKNHAASMGGHAVDGCGEFMPAPGANPSDPTSLKCAACGCHRNFHRREPDDAAAAPDFMSLHRYQPHQHPRRGDSGSSPNNSPSPPPISSAYFPPSVPAHMLLALSHGLSAAIPTAVNPPRQNSNSRKRFRTKFTQDQKDRMLELAERVEWKMQKKDEGLIKESCGEIGVERGVFKVWMHNNKNTLGKKDSQRSPPSAAGEEEHRRDSSKEENINDGTNGSSSSS